MTPSITRCIGRIFYRTILKGLLVVFIEIIWLGVERLSEGYTRRVSGEARTFLLDGEALR
jgi:hypothetical protein